MDKETVEAAARLLGLVLEQLVPGDARHTIRKTVEQVAAQVAPIFENLDVTRATGSTRRPTIREELLADADRAQANIMGIAVLVLESGGSMTQVREAIRGHILRQAVNEQQLIHTLLALPRHSPEPHSDLH